MSTCSIPNPTREGISRFVGATLIVKYRQNDRFKLIGYRAKKSQRQKMPQSLSPSSQPIRHILTAQ